MRSFPVHFKSFSQVCPTRIYGLNTAVVHPRKRSAADREQLDVRVSVCDTVSSLEVNFSFLLLYRRQQRAFRDVVSNLYLRVTQLYSAAALVTAAYRGI